MNEKEKIILPFANKTVVLVLSEITSDIDTDEITNIDYSNIVGELLTFPVIMNRVGLLRAEMQDLYSKKKLETRITEAQLGKYYRNSMRRNDGEKVKEATEKSIESAITLDEKYQVAVRNEILTEKNYNIVDALYWACKDKSGKLDSFSHKLTPQEFEQEILEGSINGVVIKVKNNVIK